MKLRQSAATRLAMAATILAAALSGPFVPGVAGEVPNPQNDRFLAVPATDQADALGKAVDEGCDGRYAFYMGIASYSGLPEGTAFWSLRCADLREFVIVIEPGEEGQIKYMECKNFTNLGTAGCFHRLGN